MQESIRFYETFGFHDVFHHIEPGGELEIAHLKLDGAFLELWWFRNHAPPPESAGTLDTDLPRIGVKHLALQVESLDRAVSLMGELGIPIAVSRRVGRTGVAYFFIKDPSGNLVEILEDNRSL